MSNNRKAFTLIELLVVIAIIAILAAILFPVFAQAKLAAKKAADLSNIKQLGTASVLYQNDYDDRWMFADTYPGPAYGDMYRWSSTVCIGPYLKNTQIFASPIDPSYTPNLSGGFSFATPTAPRVAKPISYMANALSTDLLGANSAYFPAGVTDYRGPIAPGTYYDGSGTPRHPNEDSVSSTEATNPSNLIVFTGGSQEAGKYGGCPGVINTETIAGCYGGPEDIWWGWDAANMASGTNFGAPDVNMSKAWRKAGNQSNFSFADTHAKSMAPSALLAPGQLFKLNPKYFLVLSDGF
jgi:prepilin-type N-terminal cleavage/methylation domain-containing protein